jgi:uncharacterized C2H2 Zn-finger protein
MSRDRREFSVDVQVAIIRRATDGDGRVHCERCGAWLKRRADYEIDHVLAEGMRPRGDRLRRLKAADGQLLCKAVCHRAKTSDDVGKIAEAKRIEARDLGAERPGKRKIAAPERREERGEPKRSAGVPALMRRGFEPAGRS